MRNKPQEGRSIPERMDKPLGQLKLRGATRRKRRGVSQASIDAWLDAHGAPDLALKARGRRPSATAELEKPWRGHRSTTSKDPSRAVQLVREGAALVAKTIPIDWVPRPKDANGGGSSGGPTARLTPLCLGTRVLSMRTMDTENPKSGVEGLLPRVGVEKSVKGVETSETQSAGDGCPDALKGSCAHPRTAEGETSSMSGGAPNSRFGCGEQIRAGERCRPLLSLCPGKENAKDVLCGGSPGVAVPSVATVPNQ
jgi:hypothetical protein